MPLPPRRPHFRPGPPRKPKPRPLRRLALDVLFEWARGSDHASALIDEAAQDCDLQPRDAGLLQTLIFGVLRHRSLLDHWAAMLTDNKPLDPNTRDAVRLGLVQLHVLGMAPHAAVNETVEHAGRSGALVNAVLRRSQREADALIAARDAAPLHIKHSHPEWLVQRWTEQHGAEAAEALCVWNQQPAPIYVRLNTLVAKKPNFEYTKDCGNGFYLVDSPPLDALRMGECYVQDISTAMAPDMLAPTPSHSVLDTCAAPGGKTAIMAQMMRNDGRIIATDSSVARIKRLEENITRLKAQNVTVMAYDWAKKAAGPKENKRYDRVLVDVPCSNTGVMRRRVDVRWRLKPEDFAESARTQLQLLLNTASAAAPGGHVVYSTCSIDAEENLRVVEQAVATNPQLHLVEHRQLLPWKDDMDGAFAAKLLVKF